MVFCGAESGSDAVLARMNKGTTTAQIEEVARRSREHGIIPEFSFVFGDPDEPEAEIENTLRFIRKLKLANPAAELISYFYTPTPQRSGTYGDIDALSGTPDRLDHRIDSQRRPSEIAPEVQVRDRHADERTAPGRDGRSQ